MSNKELVPWLRECLAALNSISEEAAFQRAYELWMAELTRLSEDQFASHFENVYGSSKWSHAFTTDLAYGGVPLTNNGLERANK